MAEQLPGQLPEQLDVLVVGAGMAGLTAAALLAKEGVKVGVFEKHSKNGGYMQYFGSDPTFDSATHLVGGTLPGGWLQEALAGTGVLDRVELLPLDPVYHAVWPNQRFDAAADPERFRQELSALWPGEAEGIRRFFEMMDAMGRRYLMLSGGVPEAGPLAEYHDRPLAHLLDACTRDEELRAALSGLWLYAGLPPARLSAAHYAMLWHTFHNQGSAAVKGGVKNLSQALADEIRERGGVVENRVRVTRLFRTGGRVTGARLEDGRTFETKAILANASPMEIFEELLAAEGQAAAGYQPIRDGFVASISALQVHLLVTGEIEPPARSTILHSTYDLEAAHLDLQREDPRYSALVCTVLNHGDSDRCPPGRHMVSLFTLAPYSRYDNWKVPFDARRGPEYRSMAPYTELKERLADSLVLQAEQLLPGLSGMVEKRKVGTPLSMERYTFNTGGAAFGWGNIPEQCGANRPGPRTSFRGLYLAGHWTFPGGSVCAAAMSGRLAAQAILADV